MTERLDLDVAIVGGGTAGCAAALFLAQRGVGVGLFERRTVGSQASGVNYGGVREQGRDFAELPLAAARAGSGTSCRRWSAMAASSRRRAISSWRGRRRRWRAWRPSPWARPGTGWRSS